MSDNTVHMPEDDNLSVKSGGSDKSSVSVSNAKHQCPHCPKELKTTNDPEKQDEALKTISSNLRSGDR
jgi:hypothetical protein